MSKDQGGHRTTAPRGRLGIETTWLVVVDSSHEAFKTPGQGHGGSLTKQGGSNPAE